MGLLATLQKGLLSQTKTSTPTIPLLQKSDVANSTPQTSFKTGTPIVPSPNFPITTPSTGLLKTPTLTGPTTLSQGKISPVDVVLNKLPASNEKGGYASDVVRGIVKAPAILAKEAGFLDEDNTVKLDRIAQGLITKGTDPTRAYDIASNQLQKTSTNFQGLQNAQATEKKLAVTPQEQSSVNKATLTNSAMTGLAMTNFVPVAGITEGVGKGILKIAGTKDASIITKELVDMGVPKEKIATLANVLATVDKPQVVNDLVQGAMSESKAGLLAKTEQKPALKLTEENSNKAKTVSEKRYQEEITKTEDSIKNYNHYLETGKTLDGNSPKAWDNNFVTTLLKEEQNTLNEYRATLSKYKGEIQPKPEIKAPLTLEEEAKKYKSAEDFVSNQRKLYRGETNTIRDERTIKGVLSTSENPGIAKIFSGKDGTVKEYILDPKAKIAKLEDISAEVRKMKDPSTITTNDFINLAKEQGYDAIDMKSLKLGIVSRHDPNLKGFEDEIKVLNPDVLKTKSQLTDIYNQTKGGLLKSARTSEEDAIMRAKTKARMEEPAIQKAIPMSEETKTRIEGLTAQKDAIESTGFKDLQKYESKSGEFKGGLNINNGTGQFAKSYDTKLREVFNDVNNKYTSDELVQKYENLKQEHKNINEEINTLKQDAKISRPNESKSNLSAKAEEEASSGVTKAEENLSQVPKEYREKVASLPDIIEQTQTNVKQKVNVLDYLRTPDRVLEKIGFGGEAKTVRKAYETYTKELPKNIEKITEWSKEVPKESNEKIFKYLDGQEMTLNAKEMKVANEIESWLKEWATRLKLPVDNQISKYITHIFDSELIKKEFDEDLAKIIADKLPGQVYDPFLEKRLGAMGYKQDTWQALDAYVKRATRKVHMDPALEQIRGKAGESLDMSKIEASQFKYIQRYVNNVNMRPAEIDNLIDNTLKSIFGYKYGNRPVTYLTKLLRQLTFRGMLGFNPASALRNLSQGINTYAVLGEKYTAIGYAKLFSKGSVQELKDTGVLADAFIQDRSLNATKKVIEKIDKGLFVMFQTAEHINRGAAYFGAKSKALGLGKTEEQAIEYAKKVVRDTQFSFGSIDTPVALQNDIVKTLTQFQTYTVKQIEFLTEMAKDKNFVGLLRYAVAGLVFVNTVGKAFNMTASQLIPSFRFDTPPSLKLPVEAAKAALNTPDKYGQPRTWKQKLSDVGDSALGLIPAGSQIKKTFQGAQQIKEGGSFDKGGNLQYEAPQTTAGKVQSLLFGKYTSKNAQAYFNRVDESKKDIEAVQPIYDKIQVLKTAGKNQEAIDTYDSLGEKGKTVYKKIKSAQKAEETKKGKQDILPTFQKIRALKASGKNKEALTTYDALSDDEKNYYQLLKKQLPE